MDYIVVNVTAKILVKDLSDYEASDIAETAHNQLSRSLA